MAELRSTNVWGALRAHDGGVEIFHDTPYIDFHFDNSTEDYTTRLIEDASGSLNVIGDLKVNGTAVSKEGHEHRRLYAPDGTAVVGAGKSSSTDDSGNAIYLITPSTVTGNINASLGSSSSPFYKVNTGRLEVYSAKPLFPFIGSNGSGSTVTYAPNTYVNSSGIFSRTTHANSSKTIKTDIDELKDESINAERLYDLDVVQFKYDNDKINISEDDYRYGKLLPGFIIEDLIEKYPIAVDKENEDIKDWRWNSQFLVPAMLKLIQDQKKEIESLKEDINVLKETVNN